MITVYGASDDLIEVDGDISEEFNVYGEEEGCVLGFSDGTLLTVEYTDDGIWRIHRVSTGASGFEKDESPGDDGEARTINGVQIPAYSDAVTLGGDAPMAWVVCAPLNMSKRR